ncbi:hypothetical protein M427DRAFT_53632, partial [Gonapodya prolifera JEL478]
MTSNDSSSAGNASITDASAAFWDSFAAERDAIRADLGTLRAGDASVGAACDSLNQRIADLEKKVTHAANLYLPMYDQRRCWSSVKELSQVLASKRSTLVPKAKFSFKSKKDKAPTVPSSVNTSSSSIPKPSQSLDEPLLSGPAFSKAPENAISISSVSRQLITLNAPSGTLDSQSKDVFLTDMDSCIIDLSTTTERPTILSTLHARNISNSIIIISTPGPALIHNSINCVYILSCRQLRMHDSTDVDIWLRVASRGIIEGCSSVRLADWRLLDPRLRQGSVESTVDVSSHVHEC